MRPRRVPLQRHDVGRGTFQHRAVVRDEQDRARVLDDARLEPLLPLDVERVVGLIEEHDVERGPEHDLQRQPLPLSPGEGLDRPVARFGEPATEGLVRAPVPENLRAIAARRLPRRERVGVGELRPLPRVGRQPLLGAAQGGRRHPHLRLAIGEEELPHRRGAFRRPDELAHQTDAAVHPDRARRGLFLAGDQTHEGGLADAVGPDERACGTRRGPGNRHPRTASNRRAGGTRHR